MVLLIKNFFPICKKKRLTGDFQLRFINRLIRLLDNGYPLIDALESLRWDKNMDIIAASLINHLKNGKSIDVAMSELEFHESITNYLYFVQLNGDLISGLKKSSIHFENRLKNANKFKQISRYPLILIFIFGVLLYFIKRTVLPSFTEMFQTSAEASNTINISIFLIDILSYSLLICTITTICFFFIWQFYKSKVSIESRLKFYQNIPFLRSYLRMQTSFLFATHLSTLLKTGMSIKDILQNLNKQTKLPIISYYTTLMTDELQRGRYFIHTMSEFYFFEPSLKFIFQKNEDLHALEKDLAVYADMLVEEIERKVIKSITLIQPVFFIVLACFIIFIYVTLMWPMFQLIESI